MILARIAEVVWLAALVLVPIVFDPRVNQTFEPPKVLVLSTLALVSTAAVLVGLFRNQGPPVNRGIAVTALAWLVAVGLGTLGSTDVTESLWGSYDRRSGLLLSIALIGIGAGPWMYLRTPAQLKRLGWAVAIGCVPTLLYALAQRAGLDPIGWIGRPLGVTSTLGSSTALGGYMAMTTSLTTALIVARSTPLTGAHEVRVNDPGRALAFALLGLQLVIVFLTSVRAALVGCVLGLLTTFVMFEIARGRLTRHVAAILVAALLAMTAGVVGLSVFRGASADIDRATLPRADTSLSERLDLWRSAQRYLGNAFNARPMSFLIGAGPDQQASLLEPWLERTLPSRLPTTRFDRVHLSPLDVVMTTGVFGLLSITVLLALALSQALRACRIVDPRQQALLAGVCGAIVGFIAESSVSFPSVTSLSLVAISIGAIAGVAAPGFGGPPGARRPLCWLVPLGLVILAIFASLPALFQELRADRAFQRSLAYAANEELMVGVDFAEQALRLAPHREVYAAHLTELLLRHADSAPRDQSSRPNVLDREPGVPRLLERAVAVSQRPGSTNPFMLALHARALDEQLNAGAIELGSRAAAVEAGSRAATLAPLRVDMKDTLARLYARNGDPASALRVYSEASELDPGQSQRIAEMGHAYRGLGDADEAKRLYQEALRRDDQSAEAWWGLARLSMERARWADALEPARQAARYQMGDWRFHRDLGYVYYQLGDRSAAQQELRAALRLCPSWHWESLRAQVESLRANGE